MPNDFLQQFMAGWQMGQQRRDSSRRDEMMARSAEQEQYQREQDRLERERRIQVLDLEKKRMDWEMKKERFEAQQNDLAMQQEAQKRAMMAPPTAADVGIPEQAPEMAGPSPAEINVPRPSVQMETMTGGPVEMPMLTPREEEEQRLAEQQRKMREALGMLEAQEGIKAQYREKPKTVEDIFAEAKARAAGQRAGAPPEPSGASLTGEGGKPLLSGEINKFNDFRSGLNTMERLASEVGKTGAAAKAGTMVPGFVTELTGLGTEAKSRQAVLDQAKQVVGKAMEGGVLRKEDEAKYMKILPIISDPPDVAKAKLENLKSVMAQDAEIYLETLEAAGRNVTKVRETLERQLGTTPAKSDEGWGTVAGVRVRKKVR